MISRHRFDELYGQVNSGPTVTGGMDRAELLEILDRCRLLENRVAEVRAHMLVRPVAISGYVIVRAIRRWLREDDEQRERDRLREGRWVFGGS